MTTFAEDAIAVGEKSSSSASTPRRGGDMGLKTEDMCAPLSLSLSLWACFVCLFSRVPRWLASGALARFKIFFPQHPPDFLPPFFFARFVNVNNKARFELVHT